MRHKGRRRVLSIGQWLGFAAFAVVAAVRLGRENYWFAHELARSSMQYDLVYFDDGAIRLEPIENPFVPKVLPMCSE